MDKLWPRWHKEANCLGHIDDVLFFGAPQDGMYRPTSIKNAQRFCDTCPVFAECLRHALENKEAWGIWASTTMKERQIIQDGLQSGLYTIEEIIQDREEARDERCEQRAREERREDPSGDSLRSAS